MPIPKGWFQIAYADELQPGQAFPLKYFGQDLVLFRTERGVPVLSDAFCPHLGAHLGHGGSVEGESIRCPFHAWEFGVDGRCTKVPYAKKIPPKARLQTWHCDERNGILWAWHGGEPTWRVPDVPEFGDEAWTGFDKYRWQVRTHNQEMGENAVDRAHFRYVHGTASVPESEVSFDGHIRRAVQHIKMHTPRGEVDGRIEVEAHGMGCSITRFSGICETVLLLSHTPMDQETVDSRFAFMQRREQQGRLAQAVVRDIVKQMEEDIPIWEHKRYLPGPLLCDGDGPIAAYRRWTQQFYV